MLKRNPRATKEARKLREELGKLDEVLKKEEEEDEAINIINSVIYKHATASEKRWKKIRSLFKRAEKTGWIDLEKAEKLLEEERVFEANTLKSVRGKEKDLYLEMIKTALEYDRLPKNHPMKKELEYKILGLSQEVSRRRGTLPKNIPPGLKKTYEKLEKDLKKIKEQRYGKEELRAERVKKVDMNKIVRIDKEMKQLVRSGKMKEGVYSTLKNTLVEISEGKQDPLMLLMIEEGIQHFKKKK